jgi:ammonia channel protein AmtB
MVDGEEVTTIGGFDLLGVQIASCLVIMCWSGGCSAIFFGISHKMGIFRLTEMDECLGGDLHYFGPIKFFGEPNDYDIKKIMQK